MKAPTAVILIAALGTLITGCASQGHEEPTPTATTASENEVASVVAEYAPDWQDVIDNASGCRLEFVTGSDAARSYVCRTSEETMGITAGLAARSLDELKIPGAMSSLVSETVTILERIAADDLSALCGDDGWNGSEEDDKACTAALGDRFALYQQLDAKLSAWSPYL
ncbi:hypothetical protein [Curtobacterium sp. 18060]|uniref:hypothetical protein n=1 Tax=Curtobacterium sp. 18060 TaxID=2681408 RepID=UPI00135ACC65|nr:hypothetical protein [Curtobacterium sp. 18060]